jgi:heat shock protein HslJ
MRACFAAVLLLSGCSFHTAPLDGREWILDSMKNQPLIEGSRITLRFERSTAGGYGSCNWYGTAVSTEQPALTFGAIEATARGCPQTARQEAEYFRTLGSVRSYAKSGERLLLKDHAGRVVLRFTERKALPMDPAALVNTSWRLRDSDATLSFTRDGIVGFAGCRDYTGTYHARGDRISVTSIAMSATECSRGNEALRREERFTTDLSEASHYNLTATSLEITTAPGRMLRFDRTPFRNR